MPQLSFKFLPSEISNDDQVRIISNDDQVRILIDGRDILTEIDKTMLGIDPVEFFPQKALRASGDLLIGRCGCGCVGCCDAFVSVNRLSDVVEFHSRYPWMRKTVFELPAFDQAVTAGASDTSWESIERTAERLVSQLDYSRLAQNGLTFVWASGRIAADKITLSFLRGTTQQLYDAPWDHRDPNDAVTAIREMLASWH